ncbi:hypothetical protein [Rhodohalobacter sp. 8-1]
MLGLISIKAGASIYVDQTCPFDRFGIDVEVMRELYGPGLLSTIVVAIY